MHCVDAGMVSDYCADQARACRKCIAELEKSGETGAVKLLEARRNAFLDVIKYIDEEEG